MANEGLGFIKVEAVNFGNSILDTNQLSVVRGGSYALKQIIVDIEKRLLEARIPNFTSITVGSSTGVFSCSKDARKSVLELIEKYLDSPTTINSVTFIPNEFFTFVVDDVVSDNYLNAKEQLYALGRFNQASRLSHSIPNFSSGVKSVCALNGFLPADSDNNKIKAAKDSNVSRSVDTRYQIGRKVRSDIYKDEQSSVFSKLQSIGIYSELSKEDIVDVTQFQFPSDLETLAGTHPKMSLNGKIAVIYSDGNSFGKAQKKVIEKAENKVKAQQEFDLQLRLDRARYLVDLVSFLNSQGATIVEDDQTTIQLETLLWGGDEMTLVVPAWIGLATLKHYFDFHKDYKICGQKLTFSAGIVFCSHKTPIRKAEQAAQSLADAIKDLPGGRAGNFFDYMILESIDYPTGSLDSFWSAQYGDVLASYREPLMFALESNETLSTLSRHLEALPRSGIYKLVDAALNYEEISITEPIPLNREEQQACRGTAKELPFMKKRLLDSGGEELRDAISTLSQVFVCKARSPEHPAEPLSDNKTLFWLHMLELYDYLSPAQNGKEGVTQ